MRQRFLRKIRFFVTGVLLTLLDKASAAGDCSLEIVQQSTFNGFLQFALLNCDAGDPITNHTMNGTSPLNPRTCLDAFGLVNSGPSPIPDRGACQAAFLDLLSVISRITLQRTGFAYNRTTGVVSSNYHGFSATAAAFSDFLYRTGHPVVLNACDSNYVRLQSISGFYSQAVFKILGDGTRDYNLNSVQAAGFTGGQMQPLATALCVGCYQSFLDFIQAGSMESRTVGSSSNQFSFLNFPSVILAQCVHNPQGGECMNSPQMLGARSNFSKCAGGYLEVDFLGPLCGESVSQKILEGKYFERAVVCAINDHPNAPGCESWKSDYIRLPGDLMSDCVVCVTDLLSDINLLLNKTNADMIRRNCGNFETVVSSACIQQLGHVARAFSECIGVPIENLSISSNITNDSINGDRGFDVAPIANACSQLSSLLKVTFIFVFLNMIVT